MKLNWNPPQIPQMRSRHTSGADYSAIVVYGAYRSDGSMMPGRDFLSDAIGQTDFVSPFRSKNITQGFESLNVQLHSNIKQSIQDDKWDWDRVTHRLNGQIVLSPRNIVDTGELLNSQEWEMK